MFILVITLTKGNGKREKGKEEILLSKISNHSTFHPFNLSTKNLPKQIFNKLLRKVNHLDDIFKVLY